VLEFEWFFATPTDMTQQIRHMTVTATLNNKNIKNKRIQQVHHSSVIKCQNIVSYALYNLSHKI